MSVIIKHWRRKASESRTPRLTEACLLPKRTCLDVQPGVKYVSGISGNTGKVSCGLCTGHTQGTPIQGSKLRLPGYLSGKGFHSGEDRALITAAAARVRTQLAGECGHFFLDLRLKVSSLPLLKGNFFDSVVFF